MYSSSGGIPNPEALARRLDAAVLEKPERVVRGGRKKMDIQVLASALDVCFM